MTESGTHRGFDDLFGRASAPVQIELLHDIIDAVPDAILVHRPNGSLVFFSQGACSLLGFSPEELMALKPFGWVAPEAMRGAAGRLETILHEGYLRFESQELLKNGTAVATEVFARRVDSSVGPLIVAVIHDITLRKRAQDELVRLAYHDSLTGLFNRRAFEDRLRLTIAETKRHDDLLGLGYLDLDRFKPVNDRYGHEAGDEVLIAVGRRLIACVREQDMVARMGGDEFVLLLPRLRSADEFGPLAERVLAAVREPVLACGAECAVDATIGFALFDTAVDDARSLLTKADAALYAAKHDPARFWAQWHAGLTMQGRPEAD